MRKTAIAASLALAAAFAFAAPGGRESFAAQQAMAEVQRLSAQMDVLQTNQDDLAQRMARLERTLSSRGESESLKAEIAALKSSLAEMRSQMNRQRDEIVRDLSKRLANLPSGGGSRSAPPPADDGPRGEYVVQPGDSLSLIGAAFGTSARRIREMNGLKGDNLRVGQKLIVPMGAEDGKKKRR